MRHRGSGRLAQALGLSNSAKSASGVKHSQLHPESSAAQSRVRFLPIFAGALLRLSVQMRGAPACGSEAFALGSQRSGPEAAAPQSRRRCWRCTGPGAHKSSPGAWRALLLPWRRCLTIRSNRTAAGWLAVLSCGCGRNGRLAQALGSSCEPYPNSRQWRCS